MALPFTGVFVTSSSRVATRRRIDWVIRNAVPISFAIQIGLIAYGEYQDRHMDVKYTDIDYRVFGDAVRALWKGGGGRGAQGWLTQWAGWNVGDPYTRATYRYTPLLAVILSPMHLLPDLLASISGKLLFSAVSSFVIAPMLLRSPISASPYLVHGIWTLNPIILNINTRGSSESLLVGLVLASLVLLKQRRISAAAIVWACAVHWKIYPVIYAAPILVELVRLDGGRLFGLTQWSFGFYALATSIVLNGVCWSIWGQPFLEHTYIYHIGRLDHRHNFSAYFYPIYQSMFASPARSISAASRISQIANHSPAAFVPQMLLVGVSGLVLAAKTTQEFAWFVQTVLFVAFNKVCTSQYFLWYLFFVPAIAPSLRISSRNIVSLVAVWVGGQALWLSYGYQLEFLANNVYVYLWSAGLAFMVGNTYCINKLIKSHV